MTQTPLIDLPKPTDQMVRFELYRSDNFRVFGDMYAGKRLFLHLDWAVEPKMTKTLYKELLSALASILNSAKEVSIPCIWCLVPENLVKFESLLGFHPANYYLTEDHLAENTVLMYQEV